MSFATSVNGRLVVLKSDASKLSILVQISTNTGKDDIGGATIVLSFNKSVIKFIQNPASEKDYIFHNFNGGNYNEATVTNPLSDKIWINIDLPKENSNKGKVVADTSEWTDVVTLNFNVINPNDTARVKWMFNNPFWQVYDADNSTTWSLGKFSDIEIMPPKIELITFTAQLLDENDLKLDWSTISYEENYGYEVYKITSPSFSPPSKEDDIWEKIGFVEDKKTLNSVTNYSFIDEQVNLSQDVKYRLKLLENNGDSKILSDIVVHAIMPNEFSLEQNYPNPFNPSTKISWQSPAGSWQSLKVYDILGNVIATLVDGFVEAGKHEIEFEANGLASGVYVYRLQTKDFIETKKMVLMR